MTSGRSGAKISCMSTMSDGQVIRQMADEYERYLRAYGVEPRSYSRWGFAYKPPKRCNTYITAHRVLRGRTTERFKTVRLFEWFMGKASRWNKLTPDPPDARDGRALVDFFNALGSEFLRNRYHPGDTDRSRDDVLDRMRALRVARAAETEADRAALRVLNSIENEEVQERLWKRR